MLVLGWSDGLTFLPLSFALMGSGKAKHCYVPSHTDIDRRTNGAKRRQEGIRKATDVLVDLVAQARAEGVRDRRTRKSLALLSTDMTLTFVEVVGAEFPIGIHEKNILGMRCFLYVRFFREFLPFSIPSGAKGLFLPPG